METIWGPEVSAPTMRSWPTFCSRVHPSSGPEDGESVSSGSGPFDVGAGSAAAGAVVAGPAVDVEPGSELRVEHPARVAAPSRPARTTGRRPTIRRAVGGGGPAKRWSSMARTLFHLSPVPPPSRATGCAGAVAGVVVQWPEEPTADSSVVLP